MLVFIPRPHVDRGYFENCLSKVVDGIKIEPFLAENAKVGGHYQFQRIGYFTLDSDATAAHPVFNRTIQLKDTWEKIQKK